jgi:NAD(P)-dependent dehydrogenase (short-subunit alcohol dehydrogenase family)
MSLLSALHGATSTILSNVFITLPRPDGDLRGQTIIVTGSNTGLGFEASRHLVHLGVDKLIMGVRNLDKGEIAKKEILAASEKRDHQPSIEVWPLDMDSYDSVKAFASRASSLPRLDCVLANAGVMTAIFSVTEDNEKTITTNVVSTFLLALLLLPKLQQSAEQFGIVPRIVIPNSALHYTAPLKELDIEGEIFARLNGQKTADMGSRYAVSKLLVIYVVRELADQLKASKKPLVIINTPNPSFCKSQLIRDPGVSTSFGVKVGEKLFARSTEAGSRALVHGIVSGPETNGQYLTNCHVQA